MYADGGRVRGLKRLPLNLLDAIRLTRKRPDPPAALGAEFVDSYCKLKLAEWDSYARHLTQWERDHTLDV